MGAALTVSGLSRRFGGVAALDGVDLSLAPGEALGLAGPNGSGKSSLVNVLSGHYPPDAGSVLLDGAPVGGLPAHALAARGVARTFQAPRLYRRLSVYDNLRAARHAGAPASEAFWQTRAARRREKEAILAQLSAVGLAGRAAALPGALTLIELRLLEIARVLVAAPRLLLLDEPAAGMTEEETDSLSTLLERVVLTGRTVILIEHKLGLLTRLCRRIAVMRAGALIADGPAAEVMRAPAVRACLLPEEAPCSA